MDNIFQQGKKHSQFTWDDLGDIVEGRGDLGPDMPVMVYRLMQYTMLDVHSRALGIEKANEYFRTAGFLAGSEFANNLLDPLRTSTSSWPTSRRSSKSSR